MPRVALGLALRGVATAAIDISDGLVGDLGHVLQRSGVGACIDTKIAINCIACYAALERAGGLFDSETGLRWARTAALSGGDDYELAFTAPPNRRAAVEAAGAATQTRVTRIGRIEAEPGLRLVDGQGQAVPLQLDSFDHFKN